MLQPILNYGHFIFTNCALTLMDITDIYRLDRILAS
jgi:hypothetical protein